MGSHSAASTSNSPHRRGWPFWVVIIGVTVLLALIPGAGPALAVLWILGVLVYLAFSRARRLFAEQKAAKADGAPAAALRGGTAQPVRVQATATAPPAQAAPRAPKTRTRGGGAPTGVSVQAWLSAGARPTEVVGENYREASLQRLWPKAGRIPDQDGREIYGPALVVDDHTNPHDSNAVAIWIAGEHIGYLDRDTAKTWTGTVRGLAELGQVLEVDGRLWLAKRYDGKGFNGRATIYLPEPGSIQPVNALPSEPHVLLPAGGAIQVTKEEDHLDVLAGLVAPGGTTPVAATLHAIQEVRPRSVVDAVEVRINGERVGILSPTQTANMIPLVRHVEARGKTAVARASVTGSVIKADVVLYTAKASEVTTEWLDAVGPLAPITVEHTPPARPEPEWDDAPVGES